MGQTATKFLMPHLWREDEPYSWDPLKYDPQFGFDEPRKPKVPSATVEEMDSANIPESLRDPCVYYTIRYRGCIRQNSPWWYKCKKIEEEVSHCYLNEWKHDMMEFEREKRLNIRERRIREMSS